MKTRSPEIVLQQIYSQSNDVLLLSSLRIVNANVDLFLCRDSLLKMNRDLSFIVRSSLLAILTASIMLWTSGSNRRSSVVYRYYEIFHQKHD